MGSPAVYPLLFRPVYKDYLWGGDKIIRRFGRSAPPGIYAESWEVSDRDDGMNVVANGPATGRSLKEIESEWGEALLGAGTGSTRFPLLIKLIDAKDRLSVQVHPNDETARRCGGEAKTEMWYVLDADPGAQVFAGLRPGAGRKEFEAAIRSGAFESVLAAVPVKAGDAVFMPGGRMHAIDAGCLILEVQQNSNTTYRVYDWGRVGADGKPRELHIAQAMQVARWDDPESARVKPRALPEPAPNARQEIVVCPYFRMERLELKSARALEHRPETFHVLFLASGEMSIDWPGGTQTLKPGTTVLVPAALDSVQLNPRGDCAILRVTRGSAK